jgi:hypothetical protein
VRDCELTVGTAGNSGPGPEQQLEGRTRKLESGELQCTRFGRFEGREIVVCRRVNTRQRLNFND